MTRHQASFTRFACAAFLGAAAFALPAHAATFGELSARPGDGQAMNGIGMPGPYAMPPMNPMNQPCPPQCGGAQPGFGAPLPQQGFGGPEGVFPGAIDQPQAEIPAYQANPRAFMPISPTGDLPAGQLQLWSFGQMNTATDPFNPWGLSTPYMFLPWGTPLSGWTNAQTWNWWRERSGALPHNW
jgi:hypothetical protein